MATPITNIEDWNTLLHFANVGDSGAQYEVASHYDYGLIIADVAIVAESKLNAFEWYCKAYKNGNDDAIIRTADFLSEGIYCDPDIELAIELYKKGIENGSGISANNLAAIYRDKQDYKKAFELYEIAQKLDKSNSLQLALCYHFGIGVERNVQKSHEILLKISQDTSEFRNSQYEIDEANYLLGRIYLDGEAVERAPRKACEFLKLADADNDHRSAQELLLVIGRDI